MATYTAQRKSDADLLTIVKAQIDSAATAVDGATGAVTSATVWDEAQKDDWARVWASCSTFETEAT